MADIGPNGVGREMAWGARLHQDYNFTNYYIDIDQHIGDWDITGQGMDLSGLVSVGPAAYRGTMVTTRND